MDEIYVEGTTGLVLEVRSSEDPVYMIPMNNLMPDSEFGSAMYWDWD